MCLLDRFPNLLRTGARLACGLLLSATFPDRLQAGGFLQRLKENGRVASELPALQRADGLVQSMEWLRKGPIQGPPGLRAEVVDSDGLAITTVQLVPEGRGLWVRGDVRRRGLGNRGGHLDVDLLDRGRRVLSTRAVSYLPHSVPTTYHGFTGRSQFSARFNRLPPEAAVIRVRFHGDD